MLGDDVVSGVEVIRVKELISIFVSHFAPEFIASLKGQGAALILCTLWQFHAVGGFVRQESAQGVGAHCVPEVSWRARRGGTVEGGGGRGGRGGSRQERFSDEPVRVS